MIRLFFADIDGCLSEPYRPFDWEGFATLRAWGSRAEHDPRWPRLGLCSGRSYAYVEATAQALGLRAPALFESGGGRFDLPAARIRWNPALTPTAERELDAVRAFYLEHVLPADARVSLDYGKRAQAGIVGPREADVAQHVPAVRAFVEPRFPDLRVYHTPYSIDVVPAALTKVQALAWVLGEEGLGWDEAAFIGDTDGDAEAIAAAGLGFAPRNGAPAAHAAADIVTEAPVLAGVLEAYRTCLRRNGVAEGEMASAKAARHRDEFWPT
ncbi:MAG: HAD hydrolase family protein [Rubricoccaceae bacterium]